MYQIVPQIIRNKNVNGTNLSDVLFARNRSKLVRDQQALRNTCTVVKFSKCFDFDQHFFLLYFVQCSDIPPICNHHFVNRLINYVVCVGSLKCPIFGK